MNEALPVLGRHGHKALMGSLVKEGIDLNEAPSEFGRCGHAAGIGLLVKGLVEKGINQKDAGNRIYVQMCKKRRKQKESCSVPMSFRARKSGDLCEVNYSMKTKKEPVNRSICEKCNINP